MGHIADSGTYQALASKVPLPTTDVFVARAGENGTLEVLTILRAEWPLDGFRWMLGGRSRQPPTGHPLTLCWSRWHDALFSVYREAGIQPQAFEALYSLCEADHRYWRERGDGDTPQVYNCRSSNFVALLKEGPRPELKFLKGETQLESARWISAEDLKKPELLVELGDYMRITLSMIFGERIRQLTPSEQVRPDMVLRLCAPPA